MTSRDALNTAAAQRILLIDGAFGTEGLDQIFNFYQSKISCRCQSLPVFLSGMAEKKKRRN